MPYQPPTPNSSTENDTSTTVIEARCLEQMGQSLLKINLNGPAPQHLQQKATPPNVTTTLTARTIGGETPVCDHIPSTCLTGLRGLWESVFKNNP